MVTREQVMTALVQVLSNAGAFATIGRRNRAPETIPATSTPALMVVEHSESYRNPSNVQPSIRRLNVKAIIYSDTGSDPNAIPSSVINDLLDGVDSALAPDNAITGKCTLGGLVQSVLIEGAVIKAPGDVTGKSLAVVPISILLP